MSNFQLSLQIKTSRRSGLLLLAAGMEDYLFLELLNGKVQVNVQFSASETETQVFPQENFNFNVLIHKWRQICIMAKYET